MGMDYETSVLCAFKYNIFLLDFYIQLKIGHLKSRAVKTFNS